MRSRDSTEPLALAGSETPPPAVDFVAGDLVGDYRIERVLGKGGMGTVYAAVHRVIDKRAALKVLHPELCMETSVVGRFVEEARAINSIGHPNVVDVFGFGTLPDGRAYLAMEALTGESLETRLARGRMTLVEIVETVSEITHALEAAHECGVVHRDLKPENVFLAHVRGRQTVKLLDFGIAKLIGGRRDRVKWTEPGTLLGTPAYMSPEQVRGGAIDGRCDTYSLGVMLFEMLTGSTPFAAKTALQLAALHVTKVAPSPSQRAADIPPAADALVTMMLDKDPNRRPSLAEVRTRLASLVDDSPASARGPSAAPTEPLPLVARTASRDDLTSTGQLVDAATPSRSWTLPAVGAIAAALVAVVGWSSLGRGDDAQILDEAPLAEVHAPALAHVATVGTVTHEAPDPEVSAMRALELATERDAAARMAVAMALPTRSARAAPVDLPAEPADDDRAPVEVPAAPAVPHHLVVGVLGEGNLLGTASSTTIRCSAAAHQCDLGRFAPAAPVTLQPVPQPGYHFAGWTNCLGDENECSFRLGVDVTVIARFAPDAE